MQKTTNTKPREDGDWEKNWDGREGTETTATRHLYLIRHGNYFKQTKNRDNRKLTQLGRKQLHKTGKYLKTLQDSGFRFTRLTHSTLIRAIESCDIIAQYLPKTLKKEVDGDLSEGLPYVPIPNFYYRPLEIELFAARDHERIERAFKTHFHRADPEQKKDSHEVIVCHANVIRYFVCRALQVNPAAWARMNLLHGSLTQMSIRPDGLVKVNVGDIGFMPQQLQTDRTIKLDLPAGRRIKLMVVDQNVSLCPVKKALIASKTPFEEVQYDKFKIR